MDWTVAAEYAYKNGYDKGYLESKENNQMLLWKETKKETPSAWEYVLCYYPQKNFGSNYVVDCYDTQGFTFENKYGKCTLWSELPMTPVTFLNK